MRPDGFIRENILKCSFRVIIEEDILAKVYEDKHRNGQLFQYQMKLLLFQVDAIFTLSIQQKSREIKYS